MAPAKGLLRLNIPSRARASRSIRGKKVVVPECVVVNEHGVPESGPCQGFGKLTDWNACTHGGPAKRELDLLGYIGAPAFYEASFKEVTEHDWQPETGADGEATGNLVEGGKPTVKRVRVVKPRVMQVSASRRNSSGTSVSLAKFHGAKEPEELGIAPFCEYWDCWSQDINTYTNGSFCSERHASLVYADERGIFLALPEGQKGQDMLEDQMAELRVRVVA